MWYLRFASSKEFHDKPDGTVHFRSEYQVSGHQFLW